VENSHVYCGLSDGHVTAYGLMKSAQMSLHQSFDSSCVYDTDTTRLRPILSLAVADGRVYYGDGSINLKVIDCSQGCTSPQLLQVFGSIAFIVLTAGLNY